jgi:hypothetical protein
MCCLVRAIAVIGEYGATVKWWLAKEKRKKSEKTLLQCHFVDIESHMKLPRINSGLCSEMPASTRPIHGTVPSPSAFLPIHRT